MFSTNRDSTARGTLVSTILVAAATSVAVAGSEPSPVEVAGVRVNLWFVQFDPSIEPDALPLNMRALHESHPDIAPVRDGRIQTTGLARQIKANEFAVVAGGHRLAMRDGALLSTPDAGNSRPAPWQIVSAPKLVLDIGQQGVVSVGEPVSYLTRRDDGCLVVETDSAAVEGAEMGLTAKWSKAEGVRFEDIRLKFTRLAGRQPLDGVPFDVGRPVIDTRETSLGLTIAADQIAVIPLPQGEGEAPILVFLTASQTEITPGGR